MTRNVCLRIYVRTIKSNEQSDKFTQKGNYPEVWLWDIFFYYQMIWCWSHQYPQDNTWKTAVSIHNDLVESQLLSHSFQNRKKFVSKVIFSLKGKNNLKSTLISCLDFTLCYFNFFKNKVDQQSHVIKAYNHNFVLYCCKKNYFKANNGPSLINLTRFTPWEIFYVKFHRFRKNRNIFLNYMVLKCHLLVLTGNNSAINFGPIFRRTVK